MSIASIAGRIRGESRAAQLFADDLETLRRLAWEGLYREDEPLTHVAPESGPLVSRYCEMRRELRDIRAPELQPQVAALSEIFDYHAQLLHHAVALLAVAWRSERLRLQQQWVGPIGPQADRLRGVVEELDRLAKERGAARNN